MAIQSLFDEPFLRAQWDAEFIAFQEGPESSALLARLQAWSNREQLNERSSETAFIQRFFVETWGYQLQGHATENSEYTCRPQYEVKGAGQGGGTGFADVALGHFGTGNNNIPQVLCEFKDIRSGLDARQLRKNNDRSPVDQCFDYLQSAWQSRSRDATVEPSFALVTDMNEFRLYTRRFGKAQCQRFVICDNSSTIDLLSDHPTAAFRRFLFWRMFRQDILLADHGSPVLDRLLRDQITREKAIEKTFYREYHDYRQFVFQTLVEANPEFSGTRGKLVRLTQRFLDRCIFILFCEDMGRVLRYPPDLMRDLLMEESQSRFYHPDSNRPWDAMRELFRAMREGGPFGAHTIDRFNGGLFEKDAELDRLRIPAKVFCASGQADNITQQPRTLLYFSGAYNFGLTGDSGQRVIGLYTLGRIFEQSITELEIMEAEADGRTSLNRLTKRKCDGVYYTPEWVTRYIVEHTLGTRLNDIRAELGFHGLPPVDEKILEEYRIYQSDKRRTAPNASAWRSFLRKYRFRLDRLRIVDPACGSGAFLIQALNRLVEEYRWVVAEQERIEGHPGLFDQDDIIRSILAHNIYGVDINPESVEITKLALWLHTAAPGKPLCALDKNIRCGNSLVGSDFAAFYRQKHTTLFEEADENERERINAFDWEAAFPDVFSHGGFDCVIGNPPYIKLQHFRRTQPDIAEYLVEAKGQEGDLPLYASTQSGNFDMYLPFIEKGIHLLKHEGRMGYIAPNVWMVNEYGKSLRKHIHETRTLDRWLDFKSYQIFDEAITYTALQFFHGSPADTLACAFAPDGNAATIEWQNADQIPYDELPEEDAWYFAPKTERRLLEKLKTTGTPLGDSSLTRAIFQGMVTSANPVYHLHKREPVYEVHPSEGEPYEIQIESTFIRPLITGSDAKRYQSPEPSVFLVFPYQVREGQSCLAPIKQIATEAPLTYSHLTRFEHQLRHREYPKMDNDRKWWGYVYPKNQIEQAKPKIMIASTATEIRAFVDIEGAFAPDDRRVYSVTPTNEQDLFYLLGILNAPPATYLIRKTARPKANGFYDIETQFLAPLPVPDAPPEQRADISSRARELQDLHTERRDTIQKLDRRLNSPQTAALKPALKPDWLWSDIGTVQSWKTIGGRQSLAAADGRKGLPPSNVPTELTGRALTAWAKKRHTETLEAHLDELDALLQPGSTFTVESTDDELALHIDGREILRLYDRPDTPFIAAQWRHALRDLNVTDKFTAKRLIKILLTLRTTEDAPLRDRILSLDHEITTQDTTITTKEAALNALIYQLYNLTPEDIRTVEQG